MQIEARFEKQHSVNLSMKKIAIAVLEYLDETGHMPETKQIADKIFLGHDTVNTYLWRMVKLGFAEKIGGITRNGRPEGYRFHLDKMFTDQELAELGIKESDENE